jgi:site-specific DNA-methyltransferase (adenine-specific)
MLNSFHNPDILTCLANLSSDEVFTPPNIANQMLDTLPTELWSDKTVTFLDPVSKSGVFLREITKRLIKGLENEFPKIEERIEHILKNQVFGLGITGLTSEISRRTLYLSKQANEKYSIVNFDNEEGNLRYIESQHFFADGVKCKYCGVSKKLYQRDKGLESYAYSFIHEDKPEELFNMKFDVIIGNPPYQMNDGGLGGSATPIYNKFIESAKKLQPKYLSMIIPSRWFSGGRGLDKFRKDMLNDKRITKLVDYPYSSECFPGVEIKGGICYFLWEKNANGNCEVTNVLGDKRETTTRELNEFGDSNFIRFSRAQVILKKIRKEEHKTFDSLVSFQRPFGLRTFVKGDETKNSHSIPLYTNKGLRYIDSKEIQQNLESIGQHKIFISMAYGAGETYPHQIINKPILAEPGSACTETYLMVGPFENKKQTKNALNYMRTRFFRFCVFLIKNTQHAAKNVYKFVPMQDFTKEWDDKKLYKKYNLDSSDIDFINSKIKEME